MASLKAIAAIALTLMIAVPICLGYGFATTETTTTPWEAESTTNITDRLLNSETYYTAEYMNPYNNKEMLSGGGTWEITAPNYQTLSSTYTSLPNYTSSSGTVALSSSTMQALTYSGTDGLTHSFGNESDVETTVSAADYTYFTMTSSAFTPIHWTVYLDGSYYYVNLVSSYSFLMLRDSASSWMLYINDGNGYDEYGSISTWGVYTDVDASIALYTRDYTQVSPGGNDISFVMSDKSAAKIVTNSDTYYLPITTTTPVILTASGSVTLNGTDTYSNVTGFYAVEQYSVSTITYTYSAINSNAYADPADGWTVTGQWWLNGQQNESVRFLVHLDSGEICLLGPATTPVSSAVLGLSYDGSSLTVGDYTSGVNTDLGNYSDAMVVFTMEGATVYGLSSWPTLGVWPTTFNQVYIDYNDINEPFRYVYINGTASFRVDSAQIVAGSYPTTYQLNFDPAELFPDKSFIFTFKSVAVYGDKIGLNDVPGTSLSVYWDVVDGKITVDGETLSVRGLQIKAVDDGNGGWDAYLDDIKVAEGLSEPPNIWFGSEVWSLTASLSTLAKTSSTQHTWAPGEFAFEKEDFAACGLLVAGACLIGLGMTGSRSGAKMGVLLMICGGAGLIYLTLI